MAKIEYIVTGNGVAPRTFSFHSTGDTDDAVMRAAARAVKEQYHDDDNPLLKDGYVVMRLSPIGAVDAPKPPDAPGNTPPLTP